MNLSIRLILIFIVFALLGGFGWIKNRSAVGSPEAYQELSQPSFAEPVKLELVNQQILLGETETVNLRISPGNNKVSAVTLEIRFVGSNLTFEGCELIDYEGYCNSLVSGQLKITGVNLAGKSDQFDFARLSLRGKRAGRSLIQFVEVKTLANHDGLPLDWETQDGIISIVEAPVPLTPTPLPPSSDKFFAYIPSVFR